MQRISTALAEVRHRVQVAAERAERDPADVTLVAVSKTWPAEIAREAFDAGAVHLGENRVHEGVAKKPVVPEATWHLIGPLQRNKARAALGAFDVVQTVDRWSIAERLQRVLGEEWPERRLPVLVEVNVGAEKQKAGVPPDEAAELISRCFGCANLHVQGLMAIPPWSSDPEATRSHFRTVAELRDRLQQGLGRALPQLSMGMSHDFEVAIAEGATIVRVGTAIFGPRG